MSTPVETPDRRPLLYGVFALVILIAAAYLFWPRSPQSDALVLTPESVRSLSTAADATGPIDGALAEVPDDEAAHAAVATPAEAVTDDDGPAAETKIVEVSAPPKSAPRETAKPTGERAAGTTKLAPSSTGGWVLNVGAFSSRENAQRRAQELSGQGIAAHVHDVTQEGGKTVFRVRIGYFASDSKAKSYGEWLQRNQGISSWPSQR